MADPALTIRFTRLENDRHRFDYVRPDGSGETFEMESDPQLRRDLLHFALETEAGLRGSLYGLLAKVGGYRELSIAGEDLGGEAAMTARVVAPLQAAFADELDPQTLVDRIVEFSEDMGQPPIRWLTADLVARSADRLRQLEARWAATQVGEALELAFPLPR